MADRLVVCASLVACLCWLLSRFGQELELRVARFQLRPLRRWHRRHRCVQHSVLYYPSSVRFPSGKTRAFGPFLNRNPKRPIFSE